MFRNTYQSGLFSIFYSLGSKPLAIWNSKVSNGHMRRITDEDLKSLVLEIMSTNVVTTSIQCPRDEHSSLGIKLPYFIMILKNLKKYFSFEIQILDDSNFLRRFRFSNYQTATKVNEFCTMVPLSLNDSWNQIQLNLVDFTKKAYNTNYIETTRVKIHANTRIRRIYFSDSLYTESELPAAYKIFKPVAQETKSINEIRKEIAEKAKKSLEQNITDVPPATAIDNDKSEFENFTEENVRLQHGPRKSYDTDSKRVSFSSTFDPNNPSFYSREGKSSILKQRSMESVINIREVLRSSFIMQQNNLDITEEEEFREENKENEPTTDTDTVEDEVLNEEQSISSEDQSYKYEDVMEKFSQSEELVGSNEYKYGSSITSYEGNKSVENSERFESQSKSVRMSNTISLQEYSEEDGVLGHSESQSKSFRESNQASLREYPETNRVESQSKSMRESNKATLDEYPESKKSIGGSDRFESQSKNIRGSNQVFSQEYPESKKSIGGSDRFESQSKSVRESKQTSLHEYPESKKIIGGSDRFESQSKSIRGSNAASLREYPEIHNNNEEEIQNNEQYEFEEEDEYEYKHEQSIISEEQRIESKLTVENIEEYQKNANFERNNVTNNEQEI